MSGPKLKLRAHDAEDVQIVSAVFQDSIVPVCDIAFESKEKTFFLVAQRLCHEENSTERRCCALTVSGVRAVQTHGFDPHDAEGMLDLLAIILEPQHCLNFVFAGDARIRLDLDAWSGVVEDFGEPWPALCHPCHDTEDERAE